MTTTKTISELKVTANTAISNVKGLDKSIMTAAAYTAKLEERDKALSELNKAYEKRAIDHITESEEPMTAACKLRTCPHMDTAGRTPSTRLNLCKVLRAIEEEKGDSVATDALAQIDRLVTALQDCHKSLMEDQLKTSDVRTALHKLLKMFNNDWACRGGDARFLIFATFKAGRNLGTFKTATRDNVGRYLQDVLYKVSMGEHYTVETEEQVKALLSETDDM